MSDRQEEWEDSADGYPENPALPVVAAPRRLRVGRAVVLVIAAPPEAGLVATEWRVVESLVHVPEAVQLALVRRVGVVCDACPAGPPSSSVGAAHWAAGPPRPPERRQVEEGPDATGVPASAKGWSRSILAAPIFSEKDSGPARPSCRHSGYLGVAPIPTWPGSASGAPEPESQ
jgi:hypothetical protein